MSFFIMCLLAFDGLEGDLLGMLAAVDGGDEAIPEVVEQGEDHLALGVDEEQGDQDVHGAENVGEGPEQVSLHVEEEEAGNHVVDHVSVGGDLVGLGVAEHIVDALGAGVVHTDDGGPGKDGDDNAHDPAAGIAVGHLEGHGGQLGAGDVAMDNVGIGDDDGDGGDGADNDGVQEDLAQPQED